jgi:predicted unusual protein kinase regulating ubiquinone biosynthesis (AarF/ABC1/UbiB family)
VHRAETHEGRVLALKIQYPGVRKSIASDMANLALLARTRGLSVDRLAVPEFFRMGLVQTDPNFGNYLFDAASTVLLTGSARRRPT